MAEKRKVFQNDTYAAEVVESGAGKWRVLIHCRNIRRSCTVPASGNRIETTRYKRVKTAIRAATRFIRST